LVADQSIKSRGHSNADSIRNARAAYEESSIVKYLLMMNVPGGGPYQIEGWSPQDVEAHMAFMQSFANRLRESGELVAAEALSSPDQAKPVRANSEGIPITDGVFPESKEFLAGFWMVDVANVERAYAIAAEVSAAPGVSGVPLYLTIEVRQVMSGPGGCVK
jgi:hypothetical protein